MFEVECLLNGSKKKNGVNANLVQYNLRNFKYPIDLAFSPRLRAKINPVYCLPTKWVKYLKKSSTQ